MESFHRISAQVGPMCSPPTAYAELRGQIQNFISNSDSRGAGLQEEGLSSVHCASRHEPLAFSSPGHRPRSGSGRETLSAVAEGFWALTKWKHWPSVNGLQEVAKPPSQGLSIISNSNFQDAGLQDVAKPLSQGLSILSNSDFQDAGLQEFAKPPSQGLSSVHCASRHEPLAFSSSGRRPRSGSGRETLSAVAEGFWALTKWKHWPSANGGGASGGAANQGHMVKDVPTSLPRTWPPVCPLSTR